MATDFFAERAAKTRNAAKPCACMERKEKCKMPLTHCQCPDDPTKCKACFPRTAWKVNKTLLLCKGFLKERKMPYTGKKNLIGSVHGPTNEENLNGCIPTILAGCPGLNFNNDIQIPYSRFWNLCMLLIYAMRNV